MKLNATQPDLEVGQSVGAYELLERVEALGVGSAFRVRNAQAGRIELMRVLPREMLRGSAVERFDREAKILLSLSHSNIVQLYSAGDIDGRMVLTTEIPEGRTLDLILKEGLVPLKEGLAYLSGALQGLEHVHANGVIHRCFAPSCIHVGPDGAVKISGFAFARGEWDPRLTSECIVIGIAGYMAPEQVDGTGLDARSDLYSAAAILYEIVTGQRPFESNNYFQLMRAHLSDAARAPKDLRPDISGELNRIILKGLEKDPDQRFQSAGEFCDALTAVQNALAREKR